MALQRSPAVLGQSEPGEPTRIDAIRRAVLPNDDVTGLDELADVLGERRVADAECVPDDGELDLGHPSQKTDDAQSNRRMNDLVELRDDPRSLHGFRSV